MLERTVEVQISNNTRTITLENPRTYFYNGHCSVPPRPSVPPGSNASCLFTSPSFKGCVGVLAYETDSFTLAIYFCNPLDYNRFSMELGLEISVAKVHLGNLEDTYTRMATGSSGYGIVTVSDRVALNTCQETVKVATGPVKLMATMSNDRKSIIRLEMEEVQSSGTEEKKEPQNPGRHFQKK